MRRVVLGLVVAVVGVMASAIPSAASAFDCQPRARYQAYRPPVPRYGCYDCNRPAPRGYYAPPAAYGPPPVPYYPPAVATQPYRGVFIGGPNVSLGFRF